MAVVTYIDTMNLIPQNANFTSYKCKIGTSYSQTVEPTTHMSIVNGNTLRITAPTNYQFRAKTYNVVLSKR